MSEPHSLVGSVVDSIRKASPTQIAIAVVVLLSTQWMLKGIYRVFFHPLRGFPGPKISAFTRLPKHRAIWSGDLMPYLIKLHAQYGEVVRVSPDELSFIHPDAWRDIYGHGSGHGKGSRGSLPPKDWRWYSKATNGVDTMHLTQDSQEHSSQRRIFKSAFSDRALKEQEPLFNKYIDQLVGNLRTAVSEKPDTEFDLVKNYNYTTFDVMGDLTFGEPLHMLDNSAYDPWVATIFASIKFSSIFSLLSHYPRAQRLVNSLLPVSFQKKKMEHFQYSAERVTKRLERGRATAGSDLWTRILEQEEGKQLTRGQMDSNATFFMIAGTETTATLLSGLTYYLLQNPEKLERLSTEIRSAFPTPEQLTMEAIAALPYMAACIKEGLRLYPSVPFGLPHRTPADGSTIWGILCRHILSFRRRIIPCTSRR